MPQLYSSNIRSSPVDNEVSEFVTVHRLPAQRDVSYFFSLRGRKEINPSPSGRVVTDATMSGTHRIIDSLARDEFFGTNHDSSAHSVTRRNEVSGR